MTKKSTRKSITLRMTTAEIGTLALWLNKNGTPAPSQARTVHLALISLLNYIQEHDPECVVHDEEEALKVYEKLCLNMNLHTTLTPKLDNQVKGEVGGRAHFRKFSQRNNQRVAEEAALLLAQRKEKEEKINNMLNFKGIKQ